MSTSFRKWFVLLTLLLALLVVAVAGAAGAFVEPEVEVVYTLTGDNTAWFGWGAENLGDVDGDNVNDFVTSDPFYNGANGRVYVFSGADGERLATHTGDPASLLGYGVSYAGDVNNDGVGDYVAGAPLANRATVWSGADRTTVLQDLQGPAGSFFGVTVATAGDVNGDGHDDVLVGAIGANGGAGRVYVYSGAEEGSVIRTHDGPDGGSLGYALGRIGDVTGDGVPDYVAGANQAGTQMRGRVFAYSGANGDLLYTMRPVGESGAPAAGVPTFGVFFAQGAGDIDGDGVPDIFVGDWAATVDGVAGTGRVHLYSGRNGHRLRVINAEETGDGFGPGRGIGDVNGDGHGDLVIGAYTADDGALNGGQAYVISGKNGQALRTMTSAVAGDNLGVDALSIGDVTNDGVVDYILTGSGVIYVVAGLP